MFFKGSSDLPVIFLNNSSFTNCSARSSTSLFRVQQGTVCLPSLDWVSCSFCLCGVLCVSVTFPQKDFNSSLTVCILAPCVCSSMLLSKMAMLNVFTSIQIYISWQTFNYQIQTIYSPSTTILADIVSRRSEKNKIVFSEVFPSFAAIFMFQCLWTQKSNPLLYVLHRCTPPSFYYTGV